MKKCKNCEKVKEFGEFYDHPMSRDRKMHICIICSREANRKWREKNRERSRSQALAWNRANSERHRANVRSWRIKNKEKRKIYDSIRQRTNPDRFSEASARRRASTRNACPAWADRLAIRNMYKIAKQKTNDTGVKWHVDHIVPLKSPLVCGLHVEHNLQVIPASENMSKHNRIWPEMP